MEVRLESFAALSVVRIKFTEAINISAIPAYVFCVMPLFMDAHQVGIAAGAAVLRFFIVTQAKMLRKRKKGRVPCTTKRAVV